ncbi:Respiratory-chain NADH dehydrogenase 51 Kd subunit [Haloferax elongans ATCC BAA-1513]|uniref:Respiratory-chain NADH dehydrogenase 51 Kd subunit n=1 Tax=Haloferax elongans ATCC BAA-1513 TaxID=1230453 RepID=M0HVE0_HALEO|nr:NADH dehydrogenase [Haloferax elongans]ELZ87647.1 Respiratory-chain NADH dehydrogenase 51 Kd subunit [Haloferax elongans ATCC BAA-1513]
MSVSLQNLKQADVSALATTLKNAGIAGAGGAGFPTHAKWERIDEVSSLLMNHQESEPNYYIDKWLGDTHAELYAEFFDLLLENTVELVVVCAKAKHRERWMRNVEGATDATVYLPEDLPIDPTGESGLVIAYTDDRYEYGMESVLLRVVAGVALRNELPMDQGWLVQNTETMFNIYRALESGQSVTHKYVHVDGNVPRHRFLKVPVGTPASDLLEAAGRSPDDLRDDEVLADGGPGWCFEIEGPPEEFGVTKRTNCLLVLDRTEVEENTLGNERINVLNARDWDRDHETEPSTLEPNEVRIPLITNPGFGSLVAPSQPLVDVGQWVEAGEMISVPGQDGISNAQHAPFDGTVAAVTDTHVVISREPVDVGLAAGRVLEHDHMVYWTECMECGAYIARPEWAHLGATTEYVCRDCR